MLREHVETISCTGLTPGNHLFVVENPGGGPVIEPNYTVTIGDGNASEVVISGAVRATAQDRRDLIVLGSARIID